MTRLLACSVVFATVILPAAIYCGIAAAHRSLPSIPDGATAFVSLINALVFGLFHLNKREEGKQDTQQ